MQPDILLQGERQIGAVRGMIALVDHQLFLGRKWQAFEIVPAGHVMQAVAVEGIRSTHRLEAGLNCAKLMLPNLFDGAQRTGHHAGGTSVTLTKPIGIAHRRLINGSQHEGMRRSLALGAAEVRAFRAQAIVDAMVFGPVLAALGLAITVLIQVLRVRF